MTLLDDLMPLWDVRERHRVTIAAPAARVLDAVKTTDLLRDPIVRGLLKIRGKCPDVLTIESLGEAAFTVIARSDDEIVLGKVARFWQRKAIDHPDGATRFAAFDEPGWCKAAWNFSLSSRNGSTLLETETRVRSTDPATKRRFGAYWLLIRPFSGLIRRRALAMIRRECAHG